MPEAVAVCVCVCLCVWSMKTASLTYIACYYALCMICEEVQRTHFVLMLATLVFCVWTTRPCFSLNVFPLHLNLFWISCRDWFLIGPIWYPDDRDQKSDVISFIRHSLP